jgi:acetoin utilization deacetylase AcuC-like enzyme
MSIHGHPSFAYPYFTGFSEEKGEGEGSGFNINFPLKEHLNGEEYFRTLEKAVKKIKQYKPNFLIVLLGLDTARGDPTGTWSLGPKDFFRNGELISSLNIPALVVQEGGYKNRVIGNNTKNFFQGFYGKINHTGF